MFFKKSCLNFGPQHPAAHGVLRLILFLEGEVVVGCDPHVGLLHRSTEKFIEDKNFLQSLPYFDRLDYVSAMSQEHTFSLSYENVFNTSVSVKTSIVRVLFLEITRLLNHIMSLTTHALDVGAFTPFLWLFEDREVLMSIYEDVCGSRMHSAFILFKENRFSLNNSTILKILDFSSKFNKKLIMLEEIIFSNNIWVQRLKHVGLFNNNLIKNSFSGPILRSSGYCYDLRKNLSYEMYDKFDFNIVYSTNGDSYSRFLVRFYEMRESLKIIIEGCFSLFNSSYNIFNLNNFNILKLFKLNILYNLDLFFTEGRFSDMEATILSFKNLSDSKYKNTNSYIATETPKGEFGLFIYNSDRFRIRSSGYYHLQSLID